MTAQGIGAALSTTVAGLVTALFGYSAAFLTLAGCAAAGVILFLLAMPETATKQDRVTSKGVSPHDSAVKKVGPLSLAQSPN